MNFDYMYSLYLELEKRTYPSQIVYIDIIKKNEIERALISNNSIVDLKKSVNDIVNTFNKRINNDIKKRLSISLENIKLPDQSIRTETIYAGADVKEIERCQEVLDYVIRWKNIFDVFHNIDLTILLSSIEELKNEIIFDTKSDKLITKVDNLLGDGIEVTYISQKIYDWEKYTLRRYTQLTKERNQLILEASKIRHDYFKQINKELHNIYYLDKKKFQLLCMNAINDGIKLNQHISDIFLSL